MPIPAGVETVTVSSGEPLTLPDGTPFRGHIRFVAPDLNVITADNLLFGGEAVAELVDGEFSIVLVPPDATGINPTGWTYVVHGEFTNAPDWTTFITISKDTPSVFLADVIEPNGGDANFFAGFLPLTGGTMTGAIVLPGNPSAALQAAPKQYVDAAASAAASESVSLAGDTMTGPLLMAGGGVDVNVQQAISTAIGSGVIYGGEVNASATPSSFDIGLTLAYIVDSVTDPAAPVVQTVTIPAQTVALDAGALSRVTTWILADSSGTIIQQASQPTNTQRRTHVQLGLVAQTGGVIFVDQSIPVSLASPIGQLNDLMNALGAFNITGNDLAGVAATLQLQKTVGTIFSVGSNYYNGAVRTNDPHVSTIPAQNPVSIRYATQSIGSLEAASTVIKPNTYDLNGVATAIGGVGTRSTIQRVFIAPANQTADQFIVQYGQQFYATFSEALAAVGRETFVLNPSIGAAGGVVYLGSMVIQRNATDTTLTNQVQFFPSSKFGGGVSGAAGLSALASYLLLAGGTMTGPLILSGDPSAALGAATKQYVDASSASASEWKFDVRDYGALGDARVVTDGAMASGSTTLTSATLALTEADEGKYISVKNAGANGVTTLIAVINSVESATSCTLSVANASGGVVSNAIVFVGTDDTAAIQAAIDAAEAYLVTHTYAQVYIPPLGYIIAGALNNTKSGNGQLVFGVYAMTDVKKNLEFASDVTGGSAVRTWLQTEPQHGGACLISFGVYASTVAQTANINADGNPGVISGPNEGFGYGAAANYSNIIPVLKNISFLTVHSSFGLGYGAANFWGCANAQLENFSTSSAGVVTGNDYASPGTFGTGLSVGLLLPAPGNNDLVLANSISIGGGYTYAMFFTEHGLVGRYMALYCWAGLVVIGNYAGSVGSVHAMKILAASIEACINEVYILGAGSSGIGPIIDIDQLSTESSTPNVGGAAAHMAAARGVIRWTGLFTEAGLTHDNPSGIESVNAQAISPVRTVTGTSTARVIDRVLNGDASGAAVTVNLPSAAPNPVVYTIVKIDATANTVTVDGAGSETINGATTKVLTTQWESVTIRSDGSNWIAI